MSSKADFTAAIDDCIDLLSKGDLTTKAGRERANRDVAACCAEAVCAYYTGGLSAGLGICGDVGGWIADQVAAVWNEIFGDADAQKELEKRAKEKAIGNLYDAIQYDLLPLYSDAFRDAAARVTTQAHELLPRQTYDRYWGTSSPEALADMWGASALLATYGAPAMYQNASWAAHPFYYVPEMPAVWQRCRGNVDQDLSCYTTWASEIPGEWFARLALAEQQAALSISGEAAARITEDAVRKEGTDKGLSLPPRLYAPGAMGSRLQLTTRSSGGIWIFGGLAAAAGAALWAKRRAA